MMKQIARGDGLDLINKGSLEAQWAEPASLCFHSNLRKLYTDPSILQVLPNNFGSFGYSVSEEKIFLEIDLPETRIAYVDHVC